MCARVMLSVLLPPQISYQQCPLSPGQGKWWRQIALLGVCVHAVRHLCRYVLT